MIKKSWRPNLTRDILTHILSEYDICYAVDTETTGLDTNTDKIIEIGIVKLRIEDNKFIPVEEMDLFINPEEPLSPKIIKVTGITDECLKDKPTEAEVFPQILEFLGTNPIFIAYNSAFDVGMITSLYKRNGIEFNPLLELDVLAMARDLIPGKNTKNGKFNLSIIAEALNFSTEDTHFHLAIDDIKVTIKVLNALIPKYDEIKPWECGEEEAIVYYVSHWESPYNHNQNATYVTTSHGTFTINDISHFCKDKDIGVIETINMDKIIISVAKKAGINFTTYDSLCMELPKKLKKIAKNAN